MVPAQLPRAPVVLALLLLCCGVATASVRIHVHPIMTPAAGVDWKDTYLRTVRCGLDD